MPSGPPESLTNWWCDRSTEYGFVGFSYEVSACQSPSQLKTDFFEIRNTFKGRYVRMYGFCSKNGACPDVALILIRNAVGLNALIWFGFDGGDEWKGRRDALLGILHSNPKAKYVTRALQFGSEPLLDSVLDPQTLATEVNNAKSQGGINGQISDTGLKIPVTISELAYGYQEDNGAKAVLDAIDLIDAHMLPFVSPKASTATKAWPDVLNDLNWFVDHGEGKKIYLTENGWPSATSEDVSPDSPSAVASVQNEHNYYSLLDSHCSYFKAVKGGGVGWFWHIYSDDMEPGYGLFDKNGKQKFPFSPKTSC
ncbi:glycoside hydrolase superfamily [Mycena vitilis]|nr:glycoside hydrolase superfamily [Mycena vitilis]